MLNTSGLNSQYHNADVKQHTNKRSEVLTAETINGQESDALQSSSNLGLECMNLRPLSSAQNYGVTGDKNKNFFKSGSRKFTPT